MTIPVPTVDEITGKTVMQKIRSLVNNYLGFAQEVADEVAEIEQGQITNIATAITETNIVITYTFADASVKTITLPVAVMNGTTYKTGLLALAQYNEIKASINDVAYSSTDSTFSLTFTDNASQTETITIPIVGTVAGLLTPAMYTAINNSLTDHGARITTIEGQIVTINSDITTIEGNITALDGRLTTAESNITNLQSTVTNLSGRVVTIESALPNKLDKNSGTAGTTKLYAVVNQAQQMVDLPASVAQFTNNSLGTIKGSTDDYKISANADGTGMVNGLTDLESDVMQNTSDIADLIANGVSVLSYTGDFSLTTSDWVYNNADTGDIVIFTSEQSVEFIGSAYKDGVFLRIEGAGRYNAYMARELECRNATSFIIYYYQTYGNTTAAYKSLPTVSGTCTFKIIKK